MNSSNPLLRRAGVAAVLSCATSLALAATLSGTVTFPVSDGGYEVRTISTKVRVMGTNLSANVVEDNVNRSTGTFTLANVPEGPITLIIVEPPGTNGTTGDRYTQDSKRLQLDVTGDMSDLALTPEHHWRNLPSYPPPYHDPNYDIWQPFFVDSQVGFLSFLNRGVSPNVHELWRTTNGGVDWSKIGEWVHGTAVGIPDFVSGRDMLFVDADHGVMTARFGPPGYTPVGVWRTADGGVTWEAIDFPNAPPTDTEPGSNGRISIVGYAAIDATHWIACGSENVGGYMGSGTPGWVTIWETEDAGATWQIKLTRREDYGTCSAMGADPTGRAFIFDTPYAFGGTRVLSVRDPATGSWALQAGNDLVANTGYGPADAPMLDGIAWLSGARWEGYSTIEQGTYRSTDGGLNWSKIGEGLLQSMDFGTQLKAFATAGGPAYASYDGGTTWLYQSAGGGVCCHGNYMFADGATAAIWKDGGVGDPNGTSDVFRYFEAASPHLEVLAGTGVASRTVKNGTTLAPVAALALTSRGTDTLSLQPLRVRASGSGNDQTEINAVGLWLDRNANGLVDGDDTGLASTTFNADNGEAVLDPAGAVALNQLYPQQLLVTYDLALRAREGRTFSAAVTSSQVEAVTTGGAATTVVATAPTGTVVAGQTITAQAVVPIPAPIPAQSATENAAYGYSVPAFTDPNGDTLVYEFAGLPAWLSVTYPGVNPRYVSGRPPYSESTAAANKSYTITVTARDPDGNAASSAFSLTVQNVNRAPLPPATVPNQLAVEGYSFGYSVPAFSDADGDALTYAFSGLPAWLSVSYPDVNPRYVSGRPPLSESSPGNPATYPVTLTATDGSGAQAARTFNVVVQDNRPPVPPASIPDQLATENVAFSFNVPPFSDPGGEALTYTFYGLPGWLTVSYPAVNPRYLSGRPPYTESSRTLQKSYTVTVTARDAVGQATSTTFKLAVANANRAPLPPATIPDQVANEGSSFGYSVPASSDPDGDALTYGFSGLPAWLTVSYPGVNPRYISGRPPYTEATPGNPAVYPITITATDPDGATASRTFNLSVQDVPH